MPALNYSGQRERVLDALTDDYQTTTALCEATQLDRQQVAVALMRLRKEGLANSRKVQPDAGGYFHHQHRRTGLTLPSAAVASERSAYWQNRATAAPAALRPGSDNERVLLSLSSSPISSQALSQTLGLSVGQVRSAIRYLKVRGYPIARRYETAGSGQPQAQYSLADPEQGSDADPDDLATQDATTALQSPAKRPSPQEAHDLIAPRAGSRDAIDATSSSYRKSNRAKAIGDLAELAALEFLQRLGGCAEIIHRAGQGETPGWDIDYHDAAGALHRVEVKGTEADTFNSIDITANEYRAAQQHGGQYWIFLVANCGKENPRIQRIQNPAARLAEGDWIAKPAIYSVRLTK